MGQLNISGPENQAHYSSGKIQDSTEPAHKNKLSQHVDTRALIYSQHNKLLETRSVDHVTHHRQDHSKIPSSMSHQNNDESTNGLSCQCLIENGNDEAIIVSHPHNKDDAIIEQPYSEYENIFPEYWWRTYYWVLSTEHGNEYRETI